METVGVRELRQNASEVLRRVVAGESITVTDRGRAVARLIPLTRTMGLADLLDSDQVHLPRRRMRDAGEPVSPPPGRSATHALAALREDER
ncbi:MAG: type II toxin-antitoxin system prevent-host-death family antitoxin [Kineosporiaceae bacterium]|jgi:prevent-host-death family protein